MVWVVWMVCVWMVCVVRRRGGKGGLRMEHFSVVCVALRIVVLAVVVDVVSLAMLRGIWLVSMVLCLCVLC